jgi:hypothetical protein
MGSVDPASRSPAHAINANTHTLASKRAAWAECLDNPYAAAEVCSGHVAPLALASRRTVSAACASGIAGEYR